MLIFSPAKTVLRTYVREAMVSPQNNATNFLNITPCRKIIFKSQQIRDEIVDQMRNLSNLPGWS